MQHQLLTIQLCDQYAIGTCASQNTVDVKTSSAPQKHKYKFRTLIQSNHYCVIHHMEATVSLGSLNGDDQRCGLIMPVVRCATKRHMASCGQAVQVPTSQNFHKHVLECTFWLLANPPDIQRATSVQQVNK